MGYDEATWETAETIKQLGFAEKIEEFEDRQFIPVEKSKKELDSGFTPFTESPEYKNGNTVRSYQLEGLNWLAHCYHENRNSILADEMVHMLLFLRYILGPGKDDSVDRLFGISLLEFAGYWPIFGRCPSFYPRKLGTRASHMD